MTTLRERRDRARAARLRGGCLTIVLDGICRSAYFVDDDILSVTVGQSHEYFSAYDQRLDWTVADKLREYEAQAAVSLRQPMVNRPLGPSFSHPAG